MYINIGQQHCQLRNSYNFDGCNIFTKLATFLVSLVITRSVAELVVFVPDAIFRLSCSVQSIYKITMEECNVYQLAVRRCRDQLFMSVDLNDDLLALLEQSGLITQFNSSFIRVLYNTTLNYLRLICILLLCICRIIHQDDSTLGLKMPSLARFPLMMIFVA